MMNLLVRYITLKFRLISLQDIGGGWPLGDDDAALSHVPLVWMVREAHKAGLDFDETKLAALNCWYEEDIGADGYHRTAIPTIAIDPASPEPAPEGTSAPVISQANGSHDKENSTPSTAMTAGGWVDHDNILPHHREPPDTPFHKHLHSAATKGRIHDVLQFNNGAGRLGVTAWNFMEYLPFRRMDLQEDGTWKAIRWPLPKGETRDIPANATIHCSVIKRMVADPTYRPGNLIVGGGGRGVRFAPKDMGMGKWVAICDEGHHVGECFVRKEPPSRKGTGEKMETNAKSAEQLRKKLEGEKKKKNKNHGQQSFHNSYCCYFSYC